MSEENVSLPVAQALASALAKIEAYVPTEYVDNSEPDIDAEHLNHAEQGIMRVTNLLNAAVDVIQGQEIRLADAETKIGTAALTGGMTDLSSGVNSLYSNLAGLKVVSRGRMFAPSGAWTANKAVDITVSDPNVKSSDTLLACININGASGDKIGSRFFISDGKIICNCMPTINLSESVSVSFWYLVLRG